MSLGRKEMFENRKQHCYPYTAYMFMSLKLLRSEGCNFVIVVCSPFEKCQDLFKLQLESHI